MSKKKESLVSKFRNLAPGAALILIPINYAVAQLTLSIPGMDSYIVILGVILSLLLTMLTAIIDLVITNKKLTSKKTTRRRIFASIYLFAMLIYLEDVLSCINTTDSQGGCGWSVLFNSIFIFILNVAYNIFALTTQPTPKNKDEKNIIRLKKS